MDLEPVIGLEVHLQLKTCTKLFCSCPVVFAASPNTQTCPVCLGLPGSLPVVNRQAVELALKLALALKCRINTISGFDRKNYFYPDLPKGYQITQHYVPLASNGFVEINSANGETKRIRILRLHIEEDAGKIIYTEGTRDALVDFNRCGVPLVEIVSGADFRSPQEAYDYLVEIRKIARYLDISDADMEKGHLRCDVNISLRPKGTELFGTRTEIKNLNSFAGVRDALECEIERQKKILEACGRIEQETLAYDAVSRRMIVQRSKEEAHDYRYFPEPDLRPLVLNDEIINKVEREVVELPTVRQNRFVKDYGLPPKKAEILCSQKALADYFEECAASAPSQSVADWLITETLRVANERKFSIKDLYVEPKRMAELIALLETGKITNIAAKRVYEKMISENRTPSEIIEREGLVVERTEDKLTEMAKEVLKENEAAVRDYKKGKKTAIKHLLGSLMKKSKGRADPKIAEKILEQLLKE